MGWREVQLHDGNRKISTRRVTAKVNHRRST
nr:MAG TPA: hypothetical protein [Caudoviricetes sp.]